MKEKTIFYVSILNTLFITYLYWNIYCFYYRKEPPPNGFRDANKVVPGASANFRFDLEGLERSRFEFDGSELAAKIIVRILMYMMKIYWIFNFILLVFLLHDLEI